MNYKTLTKNQVIGLITQRINEIKISIYSNEEKDIAIHELEQLKDEINSISIRVCKKSKKSRLEIGTIVKIKGESRYKDNTFKIITQYSNNDVRLEFLDGKQKGNWLEYYSEDELEVISIPNVTKG